jgi:hypothetical protein
MGLFLVLAGISASSRFKFSGNLADENHALFGTL